MSRDGYASRISTYDARANETSVTFFGIGGELVLSAGGFASITGAFDARDNQRSEAYFGAGGELVPSLDSYAKITREFDARNIRVRTICYDADGNVTVIKTFDVKGCIFLRIQYYPLLPNAILGSRRLTQHQFMARSPAVRVAAKTANILQTNLA